MSYSFIARVKSLDTDWAMMRELVGPALPAIALPHLNTRGGEYQHYIDQLSSHQRQGLYNKYWMDFQIFGYNI